MTGRQGAPVVLDAVAKSIIEQLQQDGRRSYAAIGKAVGLSEAAVRQRVQRLLEQRVVQIVAVTDPRQVGLTREAMIGIRVSGELGTVADALCELPGVDHVVISAGSFDVLAQVVCADDDHLLDLVSSQIRTIPGVVTAETFLYLKLHKKRYDWCVR